MKSNSLKRNSRKILVSSTAPLLKKKRGKDMRSRGRYNMDVSEGRKRVHQKDSHSSRRKLTRTPAITPVEITPQSAPTVTDSYHQGYDAAYNEGFNAGFAKGFEDGQGLAYKSQ